jgi:hypothetical protein
LHPMATSPLCRGCQQRWDNRQGVAGTDVANILAADGLLIARVTAGTDDGNVGASHYTFVWSRRERRNTKVDAYSPQRHPEQG